MKKYYIHNGTDQKGPYDSEDLKAEHITENTPVWFEDLDDWTNASEIDELKHLFTTTTPPPYKLDKSTPPIQKVAATPSIPNYQQGKKRNNDVLIVLIIVLLLIIVGGVFFLANKKSTGETTDPVNLEETYTEKVLTVKEIENSKPKKFLFASGKYDKNIWGNKLKIHGVIQNKATVATFKNVVVRVIFYNKTKAELGKMDHTVEAIFLPQSETKFELKIENYKNVDSIGWKVIQALPE